MGIEGKVGYNICRRAGKCQKESNRPRTNICRITKFEDKQRRLENATKSKDVGVFIYEGFSKENIESKKALLLTLLLL